MVVTIFVTLLFAVLGITNAFAFGSTRSILTTARVHKLRISALHMSTEANGEEPKTWVGAKKFSMKDRYTETVFSSEQISKILPHRYSL